MISAMARSHLTHYTIIEAATAWQRPYSDVVQMAGNGVFPAYVVAEGWSSSNPPDLEGWVEVESKSMLRSMVASSILIEKVKYQGKWYLLNKPERKFWGEVFVDRATFERFENMKGQEANTPKSQNEAPLLTAKEVAKRLGVQPDTLSKWRQQDKGPKYQKLGATVRYRKADVDEFLKNTH